MHYKNRSNNNSTQFPPPNKGDLYKQPKQVFKPHHIRIQYHNVMVLPFFGVPVHVQYYLESEKAHRKRQRTYEKKNVFARYREVIGSFGL